MYTNTGYINKLNQSEFEKWYNRVELLSRHKYDFEISLVDTQVNFRSMFDHGYSPIEAVEKVVSEHI